MRPRLLPSAFLLAAGSLLLGPAEAGAARPADPKDLNRIVNESASFLRNREPEMTAGEYALYEKVVALLAVQPDFAMQLLDGMTSGKEKPSAAFEFVLGNAHYSGGRHELAERHYRRATELYPEYLRAWANLGVLHYTCDRHEQAARCFAKAVELGDSSADTLGLMAYSLQRIGNPVAAEMAYLRALSVEPEGVDWIDGLCGLYFTSKQYGRAEPLARMLVRLRPKEVRHWLHYAGVFLAQGQRQEAVVVLESARSLGVVDQELLLQLGDLHANLGFRAEAKTLYAEAMRKAPAIGAKRLLNYAQVLLDQGDTAAAAETLAGLGADLPAELRGTLLQTRAELHAKRRDWAAARKDLEAFVADHPRNGPALLRLGQVLKECGQPGAALEAFTAAAQQPEAAYRAYLELADSELRDRHLPACANYLEQALAVENTAMVREYLDRIKTMMTQP